MPEADSNPDFPEELPHAGTLRWFYWFTVGLSLLFTITAWHFSKQQLEHQSKVRFEREADRVVELVLERLQKYELMLWGGVSTIQALGGDVTLDEWRRFAKTARIGGEYSGVTDICVIHRVPQANVESYLAAQRVLRPDFRIHPTTQTGDRFPITYIEPAEGNAPAVGLDVTYEANRYDGVKRARDTGGPQLTGPISLVQDAQGTPGFLFFVPFYRDGSNSSIEDRRANLAGIVSAPFIARELMAGILSRERRHVGVRIDDGSDLLYDEHVVSQPDYDPDPQYRTTQEVELYGRTWRFKVQSGQSFRSTVASRQPLLVLVGGIIINILLLVLFVLLTAAHRSVLASNQTLKRTINELGATQKALRSTTTSLERRDVELQRQRRAALNIAADAKAAQQEAEKAEQRSTVVVESAPNAMVMVDEAGLIVLVNAETERIFGRARADLLGQPIELLIPPRDLDGHMQPQIEFLESPGTVDLGTTRDLWGLRKDGAQFPVEIGLNPIDTPQGRFVLSAIVDISERRDAQRRFEQAVESAPNAMVMVNESGIIVLVNAEAERIFGYTRNEMLGAAVERLLPKRFVAGHPHARDSFFASSRKRSMGAGQELFARRKDGSEFPVEIGLNPIETPEGRFVLSAIVDNTDRKRILDQLENRTEEMEQLLYTVSHDLKSPLVTIQGFSVMIAEALENNDVEDARDSAARVSRATKTMAALINDVLALSRVARAGENEEWVDIEELVADVTNSLAAQFASADAQLILDTSLPRIRTIGSRMQQIFQNLIGNALKYGCDSAGGRVQVGYIERPRHHEFYVRDHGPGIDAANHRKIFVIFRRLDTTQEGSGLGLAIVMKAARSMGGQAWLESEPGEGTTFRFSVARIQQPLKDTIHD